MAEAQSAYAEGFDVTATAAGGNQDVCQIVAGSFTAGATYLLLSWFVIEDTSSANEATPKLCHGSGDTDFTDAAGAYELTGGDQRAFGGHMYVWDQPGTAEEVTLRIGQVGTGTATCDGGIFALNLDDCGAEDTAWRYNEVTVDYTTTSTTPVAQATETFTPNGTDVWLAFAHGVVNGNSGSTNHMMELHDSVLGAVSAIDLEGEDTTNDRRQYLLAHAYVPSAASHIVSARFGHESTAATVFSSRVFLINLTACFAQNAFQFTAAEQQPAASPTWTTTATVSPTPAATGNWLGLGAYNNDLAAVATADTLTRLQWNVAGGGLVSNPAYGDNAPHIDGWDNTDVTPVLIFSRESLTSGAPRPINLDVTAVAGTTQRVENRLAVAFSLELPPSGTTSEKAGTAAAGGVASAVDLEAKEYPKAGAAAAGGVSSAADAATHAEAGTVAAGTQGSGADAATSSRAGTVTTGTTAAGADAATYAETATAAAGATADAVSAVTWARTGAAIPGTQSSGASEKTVGGITSEKAGVVAAGGLSSAADVREAVEAGTVSTGTTAAGDQAAAYAETGTAAAGGQTSGADVRQATETGTIATGTLASGVSTGLFSVTYQKTGLVAAGGRSSSTDSFTGSRTGQAAAAAAASGAGAAAYATDGTVSASPAATGARVTEYRETGTVTPGTTSSGQGTSAGLVYAKAGTAAAGAAVTGSQLELVQVPPPSTWRTLATPVASSGSGRTRSRSRRIRA
jgi:hypothetical protein